MDEIRCISTSPSRLFVAVPQGVYILNRFDYSYVRCLNRADGIDGDVELCAWNPGRGNLLVTTADRVYEYSDVSDRVSQLFPPFSEVRSIGIADAAYFDTDKGLFRKHRTLPEFTPVQNLPREVAWYGERDTSRPQDYVFLNPYFVADEHLNQYTISQVRPDPVRRKLFVVAPGYGLLVYSLSSGTRETLIRLGPADRARNFIRFDGQLWFLTPNRSTALDPLGHWRYFLTRPGDPPQTASRLLQRGVTDLIRNERLFCVLSESGLPALDSSSHPPLLVGTSDGIYRLDGKGRLSSVLKLNRPVYALARLRDSVLVGTDVGLFLLTGDSLLSITDPFGRSDWGVYDIVQSRAGLLLANLGGVTMRAPDGTWLRLVPPGFDLSQPVRALAQGGHYLFAGTPAGLLACNTKDQSWTVIDSSLGLPAPDIIGLSADDHYLWIASPGLLARFDYTKALK